MKKYFSYRLIWDYMVSLTVTILFIKFNNSVDLGFMWPDPSMRSEFLLGVMAVSGSLLGFVLAAGTFLIGHVQGDRFLLLRSSKGWLQFPKLIKSNLWRLLVLTLLSGVLALTGNNLFEAASAILVFQLILSIMSLCGLIWVSATIAAIPNS